MWDIVWVSPQGRRSVYVSRHFLLQAPQCPCSARIWFSKDHCCRGRSKPGCQIVVSHTRWELTTCGNGSQHQSRWRLHSYQQTCNSSWNSIRVWTWASVLLRQLFTNICLDHGRKDLNLRMIKTTTTATNTNTVENLLIYWHGPVIFFV